VRARRLGGLGQHGGDEKTNECQRNGGWAHDVLLQASIPLNVSWAIMLGDLLVDVAVPAVEIRVFNAEQVRKSINELLLATGILGKI
jgi:hypothetical protein